MKFLKQELGNGGDVQLKNIVRTIQKEQNAIIRNTEDRILAIQGAAGSGKHPWRSIGLLIFCTMIVRI